MKRELLTLLGSRYQKITGAEVAIAMANPQAQKQVWVLVEGQLDVYFYSKIFDDAKVQIRKVLLGKGDPGSVKRAVIAIVNKQNSQGYKNIIGIVDKDYEHIVSAGELVDNVFETDYKDLEISLLNESCVRDSMSLEIPNFHTHYSISSPVSRYFGYLHITSDYYSKPFDVKVENFGWSHICNGRSSISGYKQHMLSKLNKKLTKRGLETISEMDIENVVNALGLDSMPDNIICHGHAMVKMLSMLSGHTNIYDDGHLSRLFADLCPPQTASQWNLFQQIKHWLEQQEIGYDIFHKEENLDLIE